MAGTEKERKRPNSRMFVLSLVVAAVVALPQAFVQQYFIGDDHQLVSTLAGKGRPWQSPLDLYRFYDGQTAHNQLLLDEGVLPWFTHPQFKLAFWRPLSSALFALDHQLFGTRPLGYKLHSVLWYLALVALFGVVVRRYMNVRFGYLGLLVFAAAATHYQAASWIAARNATVAVTIGLLALHAHLRWRAHQWRPGQLLSVAGLAVALLAGEVALGMIAFIVAYETFGALDRPAERLKAVAPFLLLAIVYLVAFHVMGYGAEHSGVYASPFSDLLQYLARASAKLAALLGSLLLGLPLEFWFLRPETRPVLIGAGMVATLLILFVFWPALRAIEDDSQRRTVTWIVIGSLIAALPTLAGMLGPRNALIPSIGTSILIGVAIDYWLKRRKETGIRRRLYGAVAVVLALIHLVGAPATWFMSMALQHKLYAGTQAVTTAVSFDPARLPRQDVVMLNAPDAFLGIYWRREWRLTQRQQPRSWRTLSYARCDHQIHRVAEDTLELELVGGRMMETPFQIMYRGHRYPLNQGHTVSLPRLTVTVLRSTNGRPTRVRYRFGSFLDDPSLVLLAWRQGNIERFSPPPTGQSVLVPFTRSPGML